MAKIFSFTVCGTDKTIMLICLQPGLYSMSSPPLAHNIQGCVEGLTNLCVSGLCIGAKYLAKFPPANEEASPATHLCIWDLTTDNTRLTFLTKCNYQITRYALFFFYQMMTSTLAWPSTILLGDIWHIWLVFWHYMISIFWNKSNAEIKCMYAR